VPYGSGFDAYKNYKAKPMMTKAGRDRNRPLSKLPRAGLAQAIATSDRIRAISTEIRTRHGLAPVGDGQVISGARARLASLTAPKAIDAVAIRRQLKAAENKVVKLAAQLEQVAA
jgi:hypothetical protein